VSAGLGGHNDGVINKGLDIYGPYSMNAIIKKIRFRKLHQNLWLQEVSG
jgi:hypothetical protein